ncbi:hydroxyacylglutathione hydrolase [Aliishimia ponticola]|uniref:Hydroxyacylglutathione hydrolase n=1 Tax=Aliishimia ponticola TaxID=2499833 RepID=A0A4S4NC39_9RHOB|nr:hydroxyacylglutathione hydrolase [Aliishimia ponticola]THH36972.1 hydroxyacylglutathione hydrolase [Aliishimia ponticola]
MTMPLEIVTIPCLEDNYAFLAHDPATGSTSLIDVPEAAPILAALRSRDWTLDQILITHHHWDHIAGLDDVLKVHKAKVVGARADMGRLPPLGQMVEEGDTVTIGDERGTVIDVSGHTVGHVAFHFPDSHAVFTADSLMALGCGRVFEGTKPQMWESLCKLAALPPETMIYSGHEYTEANAKFALSIDPDNAALQKRAATISELRSREEPTVPSLLSEELETNPFLRADVPALAENIGFKGAPAVDVFTEIRTRKDNF